MRLTHCGRAVGFLSNPPLAFLGHSCVYLDATGGTSFNQRPDAWQRGGHARIDFLPPRSIWRPSTRPSAGWYRIFRIHVTVTSCRCWSLLGRHNRCSPIRFDTFAALKDPTPTGRVCGGLLIYLPRFSRNPWRCPGRFSVLPQVTPLHHTESTTWFFIIDAILKISDLRTAAINPMAPA